MISKVLSNEKIKFILPFPFKSAFLHCNHSTSLEVEDWQAIGISGISKHEKTMYENTSEARVNVFIHCFRVFGYPGETRGRLVYMASQMNRDVTECFRLLI
jgi:hypothetical protein